MTLDKAVETIRRAVRVQELEDGKPDSTHDITSGGERERIAEPVEPGLFDSSERAIAAWVREVKAFADTMKASAIVLIDGPHLDRFETTMMDRTRTQRVAEPRWSVSATIGIITGT